MGYTTEFDGQFDLNKPLAPEHKAYLEAFANTRRMRRDAYTTERRPDPVRLAAGLPVGLDGGYFVGEGGHCGQGERDDRTPIGILSYNYAPSGQPGLWCQWVPNDDGSAIFWDGGEKFYDYVEWIEYLIEHFLKPWGYVLDGEVEWFGEDANDRGMICIKDNVVKVKIAKVIYEEV
jgi:hypothetical protein